MKIIRKNKIMSLFDINEFDQAESQLFLTSPKLYNIRSPKTFKKIYDELPKVRIDGMLTSESSRWYYSENIYRKDTGIFVIDGLGYKGRFEDIKKARTMFNFTDDGELCLMIVYSILFEKDQIDDNAILQSLARIKKYYERPQFAFVLNIKMPSVDILAARLMMDQ